MLKELWLYWWTNPRFWWALLWDIPAFPFAIAMRIGKMIWPHVRADSLVDNNPFLPPALLIHGSGANDFQWLPTIALYFSKHYHVQAINLHQDEDNTLSDYAEQVIRFLDQMHQERPNEPITLFGASMGGVVAAAAAVQRSVFIKEVVTFGSPFKGAPALEFMPFSSIRYRDMKPGSEFLTTLQADITHSTIPFVCYAGRSDFMVPEEYSYPEGSLVTRVSHPFGHWSGMVFGVRKFFKEK